MEAEPLIGTDPALLRQLFNMPLYDPDRLVELRGEEAAQNPTPAAAPRPAAPAAVPEAPQAGVAETRAAQAPAPVAEPSPAPAVAPMTQPAVAGSIPSMGGNAKRVLILVVETHDVFPPQDQLDFLMKILGAVKHGMQDVAIVNMHGANHTFKALQNQFAPTKILTFGMPKSGYPQLALVQRYQIMKMGGYEVINADSLADISQTEALKRALWNTLKLSFGV